MSLAGIIVSKATSAKTGFLSLLRVMRVARVFRIIPKAKARSPPPAPSPAQSPCMFTPAPPLQGGARSRPRMPLLLRLCCGGAACCRIPLLPNSSAAALMRVNPAP